MGKLNDNKVYAVGAIVAACIGAIVDTVWGVTPKTSALLVLIALLVSAKIVFLSALLVAPVKRVLFDTQDNYFYTRLHRLVRTVENSAFVEVCIGVSLFAAPDVIVVSVYYQALWVVAYGTPRVFYTLGRLVSYPTNPY